MNSSLVETTTQWSVVIQIIAAILGIYGIFLPLSPQNLVLREILTMETIVQILELSFYIWFVFNYNLDTMAITRYYDWVFTTPVMLMTSVVLFGYESSSKPIRFFDYVKDNIWDIGQIMLYNFLMLLFGYLGEIGLMDKISATILGFIFFYMSFSIVYKFAEKSVNGRNLFMLLLSIWGLYGVIYLLPEAQKNIGYNVLDIFAKNFFGVYLVYRIAQLQ